MVRLNWISSNPLSKVITYFNDVRPRFHEQLFFDKVGLSQKNMLVLIQFCVEFSLSNICDKGERAK